MNSHSDLSFFYSRHFTAWVFCLFSIVVPVVAVDVVQISATTKKSTMNNNSMSVHSSFICFQFLWCNNICLVHNKREKWMQSNQWRQSGKWNRQQHHMHKDDEMKSYRLYHMRCKKKRRKQIERKQREEKKYKSNIPFDDPKRSHKARDALSMWWYKLNWTDIAPNFIQFSSFIVASNNQYEVELLEMALLCWMMNEFRLLKR